MIQTRLTHTCPLCQFSASLYDQYLSRNYYQCPNCFGIFLAKSFLPSKDEEKNRYLEHSTDIDEGYKNFVSPIINEVTTLFTSAYQGLDFGSGTSSIIAKILHEKGYEIAEYDPIFENNTDLLTLQYDYITSCEVIEHFYEPYREFALLKSMLRKNGSLLCMTYPIDDDIIFKNWSYKNDSTHVFFYHKKTFEWLRKEFDFKSVKIQDRLIVFNNH